MPGYEMALILKNLQRPMLVQAIKRTAEAIMERGGYVRSFENLGQRTLPYQTFKHGERHKEGIYFLVNFDSAGDVLLGLHDHLDRDLDVIRDRTLRREEETARPCQYGPCDFGELTDLKNRRLKIFQRNLIKKL